MKTRSPCSGGFLWSLHADNYVSEMSEGGFGATVGKFSFEDRENVGVIGIYLSAISRAGTIMVVILPSE